MKQNTFTPHGCKNKILPPGTLGYRQAAPRDDEISILSMETCELGLRDADKDADSARST